MRSYKENKGNKDLRRVIFGVINKSIVEEKKCSKLWMSFLYIKEDEKSWSWSEKELFHWLEVNKYEAKDLSPIF